MSDALLPAVVVQRCMAGIGDGRKHSLVKSTESINDVTHKANEGGIWQ